LGAPWGRPAVAVTAYGNRDNVLGIYLENEDRIIGRNGHPLDESTPWAADALRGSRAFIHPLFPTASRRALVAHLVAHLVGGDLF
jgi:hypothetical protein